MRREDTLRERPSIPGQTQLFVLGLRRSGTTILWKILKDNTTLRAYNEPFNPLIRKFTEPGWRSFAAEFYQESLDLRERLGSAYWDIFEPILPAQELRPEFSDGQQRYLSLLLSRGSDVLIESTRCHFKIGALAKLASPEAVLVYLYRRPAEFATSHLIPSGRHLTRPEASYPSASAVHRKVVEVKARFRRIRDRRRFWSRKHGFDNWSIESIIGGGAQSPFFDLVREQGLDAEQVSKMPAVGKLLAYWKVCHEAIEREGRELFGGRYLAVSLEEWARDPNPLTEKILDLVGIGTAGELDTSAVRRPGGAYQPENPLWREFFDVLGIDEAHSPSVDA